MNVPKTLVEIISICSHHVILLSNITPKYFYMTFVSGMFHPFGMKQVGFHWWEK